MIKLDKYTRIESGCQVTYERQGNIKGENQQIVNDLITKIVSEIIEYY